MNIKLALSIVGVAAIGGIGLVEILNGSTPIIAEQSIKVDTGNHPLRCAWQCWMVPARKF